MEATPETPRVEASGIRPMECLKEAWAGLKPQYWLFLGIVLVGVILGSLVPLGIIMGPMLCGIYLCFMAKERGEKVEFGMLFKGFDYFADSFIAMLLMIAVSLVCTIVVMGIALGIAFLAAMVHPILALIPWLLGIVIMICISFCIQATMMFTFPLIAEKKLKAMDAIKTSYATVKANVKGLILVVLLMIGLQIVGALACGIGQLFMAPVIFALQFQVYRKLFPAQGAPAAAVAAPEV